MIHKGNLIMSTNAVEIMKKRFGDSPERRAQITEEKTKFSAACIIHEARKQAGLTQKELAQRINTKQSVISRLENADYNGHTLVMLKKVAEALDMNLEVSFQPKKKSVPNTRRLGRVRIIRHGAKKQHVD
jgi:ribosome-binding protein aMBF1 (putative translation factor)